MPGAPAPFIDPWAPPQYVVGTTGAPGAARSQDTIGIAGNLLGEIVNEQTYNSNLHYSVAGTIIVALVVVFVLQQLGFRFVVAAGVGK